MITMSMSWWELALLIVAACVIWGTVALVKFLNNLSETMRGINGLMASNKKDIDSIIANVDTMTSGGSEIVDKANVMVDEVQLTLHQMETNVINPSIATLGKASQILGVFKKDKKGA